MKIDWSILVTVLVALLAFKFVDKMFLDQYTTQMFEGEDE